MARLGGFWINPEGGLLDVGDRFHEEFAESVTGLNFKEAMREGWVRVRAYTQYGVEHLIVHGTASGIEGAKDTLLETWGDRIMDIQVQVEPLSTGFASYSTVSPKEFYESDIDHLEWALRMVEAHRRPIHIAKYRRRA
jgi:hypothetical protein